MEPGTRVRENIETARYSRMRIAVVSGPDQGLALELAGTTVIVGTQESATLRLSDETVSREHCEIVLHERGFRVRDLQSTNGVRVHGMYVYDVSSSAALQLELGDTVIAVTPLPDVEPRERSSLGRFGQLVGEAPKMRELFALLTRVAPLDLPVLIEGETGTGKELVAESIHAASARMEGAFVIFDCSVVAANLMESDLFGHERGAFTGAQTTRVGALEDAHGGTLFLDEIGELPLELQQKLLRCLQSGEYRRVGGRRVNKTDVRVIAATNRNLRAEVKAGRFREDLYYRLEGVLVRVPPLRERSEDIPLLVDHFLRQNGAARQKPALSSLPAHALAMFRAHRWPGNVRELANVVRRMQLLPDLPWSPDPVPRDPAGKQLTATVEPQRVGRTELEGVALRLAAMRGAQANHEDWMTLEQARHLVQDALERDYLTLLRRLSRENKTHAAAWSGVTRQAIQKLVRKHDFDWETQDAYTVDE